MSPKRVSLNVIAFCGQTAKQAPQAVQNSFLTIDSMVLIVIPLFLTYFVFCSIIIVVY